MTVSMFSLTTAQRPVFSFATLFNAVMIAITIIATISPYSTAVAPLVSPKIAFRNVVAFMVIPQSKRSDEPGFAEQS